jgi:hypothetical protein
MNLVHLQKFQLGPVDPPDPEDQLHLLDLRDLLLQSGLSVQLRLLHLCHQSDLPGLWLQRDQ